MASPEVKCTVNHCTHYMSGDQCMAGKISVYNDERTGESSSSADTLCKSFHYRDGMGDMIGAMHNANVTGTMMAPFKDGKQITPAVECFVNRCAHWEDGNFCNATSIEINGSEAVRNEETDCRTFKAK